MKTSQRPGRLPGRKRFSSKDFREILDRKDVDAVLIGAPDHQHVPLTLAACEAGKHLYVEKPLTHQMAEGRVILDAQKRTNRIVQVGMQQRSMPHIQKGYEIVKSGKIGKARLLRMFQSTRPRRRFALALPFQSTRP